MALMEGVLDSDDYLIIIKSLKVDNEKLNNENIRLRKMIASIKAKYTITSKSGQCYINQAQAVFKKALLRPTKPAGTMRYDPQQL